MKEYEIEDSCIGNVSEGEVLEELKYMNNLNSFVLTVKVPKPIVNKTKNWSYKDKTTLNVVITNLMSSTNDNFYYSRDNNVDRLDTAYNPKNISNVQIRKAIDYLVTQKLVTNKIADRHFDSYYKKDISSVRANKDMAILFDGCTESCKETVVKDRQCIILKNKEGKMIDYKKYPAYEREKLVFGNNFQSKIVVSYKGMRLNTTADRHYKHNFDNYGRLFIKGLSYQNMTKEQRTHIEIDGEECIEIDFRSLHFRILLEKFLLSHHVADTPDLYALVIDNDASVEDRNVVKKAINIYFNCKTRKAAIQALQLVLNKKGNKSCFKNATEVFDKIDWTFPYLFKNTAIMAHIFNGTIPMAGMLQRIESDICADVRATLSENGIFVGTIHDSFLCKRQDFDTVKEVIGTAYRKNLNVDDPVPVSIIYKDSVWNDML